MSMFLHAAARVLGLGRTTFPTAALIVALGFCAAAAPAALRHPGPVGVPGAPGGEDPAHAALSEAGAARRAAQKLEAEARDAALIEVAGRYDAIADNGDFDAAARAEAAFRAGEILRARGQLAESEPRFARAVELGSRPPRGASSPRAGCSSRPTCTGGRTTRLARSSCTRRCASASPISVARRPTP